MSPSADDLASTGGDPFRVDDASRALVVAIDGPAGSGKSTVAALVADALDVPHVDTGALYRAAALACVRAGVDLDDHAACTDVVARARIERVEQRTLLDGEDVEEEIRGDGVTAAVSRVAAHQGVRDALVPAQRAAVAASGGVVEGRDIGTVVLPDADVKVFLTASAEERARRRALQLGRDDVEELAATIARRDEADSSRAVAPLSAADDAWVFDTTGLDIDEVVAGIVDRAHTSRDHAIPDDPVSTHRSLPRVAVVGRPNVGKSTLVNRIVGRRGAIVEERPGVTRDRVEYLASWDGRDLLIVDTGGWEHSAQGMGERIAEQAKRAIETSDVVVFVADATVGVQEDDERFARVLRRAGVPVLLAGNKVDSQRHEPQAHELAALGLGDVHPVSALAGRGVGDLLDGVVASLPPGRPTADGLSAAPSVAIVGRPNVGKSSLFNRLVGEERSLVDDVAHTTRDAVDTYVDLDERAWRFVDTAGMRRRYRHGEDTEMYAVDRTRATLATADLALFVVDASEPLGEQDQKLAALVRDSGCGVILVCNKWDLVDDDRRHELDRELERLLGFASWAPRVRVSATTGRGTHRIAGHLALVFANYIRRIPTRELNRIIQQAVASHAPPRRGNRQLRVRYATQPETRPPRFVLFCNGDLPDGYLRYLERIIREHHDFTGVPLILDDRRRAAASRKR